MQEYLIVLLVISLVLLVAFHLFRKSIPLSTRIIYGTVAISFFLGAIFPEAISNFSIDKLLGIYFGLIAVSAITLSYIENRIAQNVNNASDVTPDTEDVMGNEQPKTVGETSESSPVAGLELPVPDNIPDLPVTLTAQPDIPVDVVPELDLTPATPVVSPDTEDFTGDEQPESDSFTPELSPVVGLELPVPVNMPGLPVTLTPQPDIPVDVVPELDLTPATPFVSYDTEDFTGDEQPESDSFTPEFSPVVGLELPVPVNMPGLPVALTAQPDFPVDVVPELDLTPVTPVVSYDTEDFTGEEAYEPDYTEQLTAFLEESSDPEISADIELEAPTATNSDGIINDFISAGFEAKTRGDLDDAVNYFFKALRLNQSGQVSIVLAMEIAAVYQELGQYLQAKMIINSVLGQEDLIHDYASKQKLKSQIVYLDTLIELLRNVKMSNAPYSKIPNLIKMKASIESSMKLTNLTKEAG